MHRRRTERQPPASWDSLLEGLLKREVSRVQGRAPFQAPWRTLWRLLGSVARHRGLVALSVVTMVALAGVDLLLPEIVKRAVDGPMREAAQALGPLSLVVNVAGGATGGGRTVDRHGNPHDKDVFVSPMAMNATGTFNVTRLTAPLMAANEPDAEGEKGVVVNTASLTPTNGTSLCPAAGVAQPCNPSAIATPKRTAASWPSKPVTTVN